MAVVSQSEVIFFSFLILLVFCGLMGLFFFGRWVQKKQTCLSPYTGKPLRRGYNIPEQTREKVLRYLFDMHQYDNRMFDVRKAALCRDTGRLFPNSVTWLDTIHVDWMFLQKRYPGNWVSWGSLTDSQQEAVRAAHHSLEDYQTERSSMHPSPRAIEPEYVYLKPGPLYVDLETKVLLGWKCVPDTELEVLVVQKPKGIFELPKGLG